MVYKSSLPSALELMTPNALIMLGLASYWHSVRLLCGQPARFFFLLAPVAVASAGVYIFHLVYPNVWMRILLVALVWMLMLFGSAATLHRNTDHNSRRSRQALAWLFYGVGVCTVLRLLYYSQLDLSMSFDVTDNKYWGTRLTPLLALALPVLGSTILVLYCYERVRNRAKL